MRQTIESSGYYFRIRREFWQRAYLRFLSSERLQTLSPMEGVTRQDIAARQADAAMGEWDARFVAVEGKQKRRR